MKLQVGQHIFLVGIGGSGLSAIARVLLGQGYTVSGSDRSLNSMTEALARDGATIYQGHDAAQIKGADALIITSAVKSDHVEVVAARAAGIPVYKRQDIMADLMEGKTVIAVAGTKGKTTTTSMIVHILRECGQDPSYIVGGIMGNTGTNAGVGKGSAFVVEADEYDNMFLGLKPDIAVITNIEWDHPDFFKTSQDMIESFVKFAQLLDQSDWGAGGILIANGDDANIQKVITALKSNRGIAGRIILNFGVKEGKRTDLRPRNIRTTDQSTVFQVGDLFSPITVTTPLFGMHNILNTLAAIGAAGKTGTILDGHSIDYEKISASLINFKPTARRFDLRADVGGIAVVDDYAHNPMSIRAVIEAAKQRYPEREVWAVWQPHTYSRTQALFDQFLTAFDEADHVLVTDIYAAREAPIEGVTSAAVVQVMQHKDARLTATFADTVAVLHNEVKAPAVIVIMSAGDAPEIGVQYLKRLQEAL